MHGIGAAAIGSKIYLFGGNCGNDVYSTAIHVFDTSNNTISTLDATILPSAIYKFGVVAIGTKIYLFGGDDGTNHQDCILVFNSDDESISTLGVTLPQKAYGMGVGMFNSHIYLFGGDNPASYLDTIEVFDTTTESFVPGACYLPSGDVLILTAQSKNTFKLFDSDSMLVQVGVDGVYIGNEDNCISTGVDAYLYDGNSWVQIV
jgi:N-acetylneuraminic acid mutarotase